MPISIDAIRNLLAPGFRGALDAENVNGDHWDIVVNRDTDAIEVSHPKGKTVLFSRKDLDDNTYKKDFSSKVREIIRSQR